MKTAEYQPREYRKNYNPERFRFFRVVYKETDLSVGVQPDAPIHDIAHYSLKYVTCLRSLLDSMQETNTEYFSSLVPVSWETLNFGFLESIDFNQFPLTETDFIEGITATCSATTIAGVGPMAAIAGLFAESLGKALKNKFHLADLVIENGGDIFAVTSTALKVSISAGNSPLSDKLKIVIPVASQGIGVCTSSGTTGHSLSFGKADAVTIVAESAVLADALATATCNMIQTCQDLGKALLFARKKNILSTVAVLNDQVAVWSNLRIDFI